jgi:cytochrome oxidase Cu insertion factor (SCO1/SenC/PrrC family)
MRGAQKIGRLTLLFAVFGVALTCGLPLGHAQGSKQAELPDGLTRVSPAVRMPAFSLPGLTGDAFHSSALQGQVAVVRFWATW